MNSISLKERFPDLMKLLNCLINLGTRSTKLRLSYLPQSVIKSLEIYNQRVRTFKKRTNYTKSQKLKIFLKHWWARLKSSRKSMESMLKELNRESKWERWSLQCQSWSKRAASGSCWICPGSRSGRSISISTWSWVLRTRSLQKSLKCLRRSTGVLSPSPLVNGSLYPIATKISSGKTLSWRKICGKVRTSSL